MIEKSSTKEPNPAMTLISTPDLCDENETSVDVVDPIFQSFGGRRHFYGQIVTIKCHEDNSLVKEQAACAGRDRVMVVDGGGSKRRALLGDMVAANAVKNGWAGLIIFGAVRDVDALAELDLGVRALSAIPLKTEKRRIGELNIPVRFAGVLFEPDDWVYADANGILRSANQL